MTSPATEPLRLAPDDATACELRLVDAGGSCAVVSVAAAARLTSIHEWTLECAAHRRALGDDVLTTELPKLDPTELAHLEDDGVIAIGTAVSPGVVLVGRVTPTSGAEGSPEERELAAMLSIRSDVRDTSLRCPPGVDGVVIRAERLAPDAVRGELARVAVTIQTQRQLGVGDALRAAGRTVVVAAIAEDLDADAAWPGLAGTHPVEKLACARHLAQARSIGPYSLITQQPLAGAHSFSGQRVGPAELAALRARRADVVVHELVTVKCDDIDGRIALYTSIVRNEPRTRATTPESTRVLGSELRALGFDVDITADPLAIRLLDADALAGMRGPVKLPETINYRTLLPIPDGLFCEAIFGSVYEARARRSNEGRIDLPAPILHPWLFPEVARLLGVSARDLVGIVYDGRALGGGPVSTWHDTGVWAIESALAGLGAAAHGLVFHQWPVLPADLRPLVPLDGGRFATSDLNDLYRRLINRANRLRRLGELGAPDPILINEHAMVQRAADALVENGLRQKRVTGPDRRPLVSLADLIAPPTGRLVARARRVDYSAAGASVPRSELTGRVAVPRALALELWRPFVYGRLERDGHVATIKEARRLADAYDARALDALEAVTADYPVVLFPATTDGDAPAPVAALAVVLWDEHAFGLPPPIFDRLGRGAIVMHVPIDPDAVAEVRRLEDAAPVARRERSNGWLARAMRAADRAEVRDILVAAAMGREVDPITDDDTRSFLGRPPVGL